MSKNDIWVLHSIAGGYGANVALLASSVLGNLPHFPWGFNSPDVDRIKDVPFFKTSRTLDGTVAVTDLYSMFELFWTERDSFSEYMDDSHFLRLETARVNSIRRLKDLLEKEEPESLTLGIYNTKPTYNCPPNLPLALQCTHWDLTMLLDRLGYLFASPDEDFHIEPTDAHKGYETFFERCCYTEGKNQCLATKIVRDW